MAKLNPWRDLARLPREIWILSISSFINRLGTMVAGPLSGRLIDRGADRRHLDLWRNAPFPHGFGVCCGHRTT